MLFLNSYAHFGQCIIGWVKNGFFWNSLFHVLWIVLHIKIYLCAKFELNWTKSSFAKIHLFLKYVGKIEIAVSF